MQSFFKKSAFCTIFILLIISTFSCANSTEDVTQPNYSNANTYIMGNISGKFSDEFYSRFQHRTNSLDDADVAIVDSNVFIQTDIADCIQLFWHVIKGKTLVIINPTLATYSGIEIMIGMFKNPENGYITNDDFLNYINKINDLETSLLTILEQPDENATTNMEAFFNYSINEAVALHGTHVYIVRKVDKVFCNPGTYETSIYSKTGGKTVGPQENEEKPEQKETDFSENYKEASNLLVNWIDNNINSNSSRYTYNDINDLQEQTISTSFTVYKPDDAPGNNATAEIKITVWAVSDIPDNAAVGTDKYVIKTEVTCNNQELNFTDTTHGKVDGWISPYMTSLTVSTQAKNLLGLSTIQNYNPITNPNHILVKGAEISVKNAGLNGLGSTSGSMGPHRWKWNSKSNINEASVTAQNENGKITWKNVMRDLNFRTESTENSCKLIYEKPADCAKRKTVFEHWQTVEMNHLLSYKNEDTKHIMIECNVEAEIGASYIHTFENNSTDCASVTLHSKKSYGLCNFVVQKPNGIVKYITVKLDKDNVPQPPKNNPFYNLELQNSIDHVDKTLKSITPLYDTAIPYFMITESQTYNSTIIHLKNMIDIFKPHYSEIITGGAWAPELSLLAEDNTNIVHICYKINGIATPFILEPLPEIP